MSVDWTITAFVEAHFEWDGSRGELTTTQKENGWHYIYYHGAAIGRVKATEREIVAESFVSK